MRVLIGGSHGLIGTRLIERLQESGHQAVRLARWAESQSDILWDPGKGPLDPRQLELFDAVVHLGGVSIGEKRWTDREKQRLWDSRIKSTDALVRSLSGLINRPRTLICASAVGYYGDQGDTELTESSPSGSGFLAELCRQWEKSANAAREYDIRVVSLRSGVVFSDKGGSLPRQIPLFKLCLGGRLGSGRQWMSWIDIDDEVDAILHILEHDSIEGPVNITSPDTITNYDYTTMLAAVLRRPALVPAPRWMISLALGGQLTDEVLLASARVIPQKLLDSGFQFKHANPAESLVRLLSPEDLSLVQDESGGFDLGPRPVIDITESDTNGNGKHSKPDDEN
jgi:uncharacterized protein